MLAPLVIGDQRLAPHALRARVGLQPGDPSAPAGSRIARVSSKTSLIAAQISSVSTTTISSTQLAARGGTSRRRPAAPRRRRRRGRRRSSTTRSPAPQRPRHRVGVDRLDADDPDLGPQRLHVGGDAGDQPAAADRARRSPGSAPGAGGGSPCRSCPGRRSRRDRRTGGRRSGPRAASQRSGVRVGLVVAVAVRARPRAPSAAHRVDLDAGRGDRHDDRPPGSRGCCAASATPCAWLPAEAQITPRAQRRRRGRRAILL